MNQSLKIKVKVKGKCLLLSLNQQQTIQSIIRLLKANTTISRSVSEEDLDIQSTWSRIPIISKMKIGEVAVNEKSGLREIQINNRNWQVQDFQSTLYDAESERIFKAACENLLNNDQEALYKMERQKKLSNTLLSMLFRIKDRMKKNEDTAKQAERQKQQAEKLNKLLSMNKQNQSKLANAVKQIQTLQLYIQNMQISENNAKIISEPKLSGESINVLHQMYEKIQKEIKFLKEVYERKIVESCQSIEKSVKLSRKVGDYSLLYKSRTFQIENFKEKLQEYSQKLRSFVEDFTNNEITEIKPCFFIDGSNPTNFIKDTKGKANSILLFSSGDKLFGIFTVDPFGVKSKSANGFFFWLSEGKAYTLKLKQPVWKSSAIDIKIGNDSLIMGEPTKKGAQLKIKHKNSLKDSFEIQEQEVKRLIGSVGNEISISSFQVLTVSLLHEQIQANQMSMSMYESVYLKTEESV